MRRLILAALAASGFTAAAAGAAFAANDHTTSVLTVPSAPPAPAAQPAPPPPVTVVQPPPPPAPPPQPKIVQTPWPANVPSFKPGTGQAFFEVPAPKAVAAAAKTGTGAAVATTDVKLQASAMAGLKPLKDTTIVWTVYKADANNQPTERLASQTGAQAEFSLAPATYVIGIRNGETIGSQVVIVGSQPISKVIPLNISTVQVKMIPYTGAKPVTDPVHWEIFANALGRPGPDSKVADRFEPMSIFHLAPGYYVLRSHYQGTHSDLAMLIEPAVTYHYTVDLYAASVSAQAVVAGGKKPKADVSWQIVRAQADGNGQHEVIGTNTGASPIFLLREGNYLLIATSADGATGQAPVSILAGKAQKVKVVLKPAAPGTATTATTTTGGG